MEKIDYKNLDPDELFLIYTQNRPLHIQIILAKINDLDEQNSSLSDAERLKLIFDILCDFRILKSECTTEKGQSFKDIPIIEFLKKYDKYIPTKNELEVFFALNDMEIAEEYIKYNYEKIKESFSMNYIVFKELENDTINNYKYEDIKFIISGINNKKEIFFVPGSYNRREINYLLYKYFKDDIVFIFEEITSDLKNDIWRGICQDLSWKYQKIILKDLYEKGDIDTFKEIICQYVHVDAPLPEFLDALDYRVASINFLSSIFLKRIKEEMSYEIPNYTHLCMKIESCIRNKLNKGIKKADRILDNDFFANLKYLNSIPKNERKNNELYQYDFELFFEFLKSYYPFDIEEYKSVIISMFNRIINGNSLFEVLHISSITSLWHYYKTNEVINIDNKVTLEQIKNYNVKQYLDIKKLIEKSNQSSIFVFFREESIASLSIIFLYYLDYNQLKKMLCGGVFPGTIEKICKFRFANEESRKKFFNIINKNLDLLVKYQEEISTILNLFTYLEEQKYSNITLPQIIKRIESFDYVLLPNMFEVKENIHLLDKVNKGHPINEKIEGVKLYNDYRFRTNSSIPDINDKIKDLSYEMVDIHSPEIISNGVFKYLHSNGETASSCLTPAGKAASCLKHGATNVHGRFFKITDSKGQIVAYSWVWRAGDIICFDNIELTEFYQQYNEKIIVDIYKQAANKLIEVSKQKEKRPVKAVIIGRNKLDIIHNELNKLPKVTDFKVENFKPNNSDNLYLEDSKENQYILAGEINEKIKTEDCDAIYLYQRKPVIEFKELGEKELKGRLNSICFDYCIYLNKKYHTIENEYVRGYLGEDWFVGFYENGTYDFYYRFPSDTIKDEASKYISCSDKLIKKVKLNLGNYDDLPYFLNDDNYSYNVNEVLEYLKSIKKALDTITKNDFFHTPRNIENLGKILYDCAITSQEFGNHVGGMGSNGAHFICIAELFSNLYHILSSDAGFIIDGNICSFPTMVEIKKTRGLYNNFINSRYPIRETGGVGEKQVLDYILLDSVKAIRVNSNILNIGKICYMLERTNNNIPVVKGDEFLIIDQSEIKRLIRLK